MAFITDKEELKPGLIIFRRTDVDHRNWYCRVKLPKEDRYKTISLKTADVTAAREKAFDYDADVRFRLKHDVPVFNRPFSDVAKEYVASQERRAATGEITCLRVKKIESIIKAQLNPYVGSTQVHLIGHERWENYPTWRRETSEGRVARTGQTRPLTENEKTAAASRVIGKRKPRTEWVFVSDSTISTEMSVFSGIMNFAASKRYIPAANKFGGRPKLKTERRDEFSLEEYRKLHTVGRQWMKAPDREASRWSREVTYNFMLIMCNTGMRPPEAANLRWRDISRAEDKDERQLVVIYVRGKGKERKLVAPASVGDYLERIRKLSRATKPDDRVFTIHNGKPAKTLYSTLIEDLFDTAGLREGPSGTPRSTYSFRHTYATLRLSQGIDVYLLAEQMGTSVKMIEDHYGHVNTIKHADRVLHGIGGWEPPVAEVTAADEATAATSKAAARAAAKSRTPKGPRKPH
jgi:integrase